MKKYEPKELVAICPIQILSVPRPCAGAENSVTFASSGTRPTPGMAGSAARVNDKTRGRGMRREDSYIRRERGTGHYHAAWLFLQCGHHGEHHVGYPGEHLEEYCTWLSAAARGERLFTTFKEN